MEDEIIESRNLINDIIENGNEISICWSPGHVGIEGNEIADKAAKSTTEEDPKHQKRETATSIRKKLKRSINERRQQKWDEERNNWYKNFKPRIKTMRIMNGERRKDVQLRRLKFGITKKTHDYMIKGEGAPDCECLEALTVRHWLIDCTANESELHQIPVDEKLFEDPELLTEVLEIGAHLH